MADVADGAEQVSLCEAVLPEEEPRLPEELTRGWAGG